MWKSFKVQGRILVLLQVGNIIDSRSAAPFKKETHVWVLLDSRDDSVNFSQVYVNLGSGCSDNDTISFRFVRPCDLLTVYENPSSIGKLSANNSSERFPPPFPRTLSYSKSDLLCCKLMGTTTQLIFSKRAV